MSAAMSGSSSMTSTRGTGAAFGCASMGSLTMARRLPVTRAPAGSPCPDQRLELPLRQRVVRPLGGREDPAGQVLVGGIVAVLLEPVLHVRQSGHRPDLDQLLSTDHRGRDGGIDAVRQPRIALELGRA